MQKTIGKCHNVPDWESGPSGPFDHWPTGLAFQYSYGFLGGGTNQWAPDHAITWIRHWVSARRTSDSPRGPTRSPPGTACLRRRRVAARRRRLDDLHLRLPRCPVGPPHAVEFVPEEGGFGPGGLVTLSLDGAPIGSGQLTSTVPWTMSYVEGLNVGLDTGAPVSEDYQVPFALTGTLHRVELHLE